MFQLQCGESCNGVIDAWTLSCSPPKHGHGHEIARPLADCQASSQPYLSTLAYCLKEHCFAEPWNKVEHYWSWLQGDRDSKWPTLLDTIPTSEPPLAPVGMTNLNQTVRVRSDAYNTDYATAQAFAWNERWHERASYILIFVVLGFLMVGAVHKIFQSHRAPYNSNSFRSSKWVTMLQKRLFMPALFNGFQSAPILGGLGYLPSRLMVVFLLFFVGLCAVANSVPYKSLQPNLWAINRRQEVMGFVANRAGLISFALIPLTILLSVRNNPILWLTGWSTSTMITLHRWVARMCAFQAVLHSVGWTVQWYWDDGDWTTYRSEGAMPYMQWGFMATVAICVTLFFAALPFRRWSYEIFLVLHILLVVFVIIGCYYHIVWRFKWRYGYLNWIYVAIGIWLADRSLRLISVWKNGLQGSIGQTTGSAIAELVPNSTQNIIKLTVFPRLELSLVKPGVHYFIYFPSLGRPWENHPFTVASWNLSDGATDSPTVSPSVHSQEADIEKVQIKSKPLPQPSITIFVKPYAGTTRKLLKHLSEKGTAHIPVSLEGPYGQVQPLHLFERIVLVAGGIGITPAIAYARDLPSRGRSVTLVWATRDSGLIQAVRPILPTSIETRIYYTGTGDRMTDEVPSLRPNVMQLVQEEIMAEQEGRTAFFVCGPAQMVDQVRAACVDCVGDKVSADKIGFYEESFSW
ncbi:ferric-chelate reductase, putative [Rhizoctonia solani AG-3 Rhs1AP]|uniref:Ferric-chelate reductase, putative n=2 Tax=Rhizoctonia solani AG-3 TaxID=1086053 RepID=A0A0A1UL31_9AGAM|nr:ferric-chelate reductase, putative [Rhizoctonia solani AG-3 Rhs1AP]KEP47388.1 putative ferric-chelate reductase [Rhizoctonia solani 123E]